MIANPIDGAVSPEPRATLFSLSAASAQPCSLPRPAATSLRVRKLGRTRARVGRDCWRQSSPPTSSARCGRNILTTTHCALFSRWTDNRCTRSVCLANRLQMGRRATSSCSRRSSNSCWNSIWTAHTSTGQRGSAVPDGAMLTTRQ